MRVFLARLACAQAHRCSSSQGRCGISKKTWHACAQAHRCRSSQGRWGIGTTRTLMQSSQCGQYKFISGASFGLERGPIHPPVPPVTAAGCFRCLVSRKYVSSSTAVTAVTSTAAVTAEAPIALIFDTETTGMVAFDRPPHDPAQPDLVQLGMILVDTGTWKCHLRTSMLVRLRPGVTIDPKALATHGISSDMTGRFGVAPDAAAKILSEALLRADVIVAHNLGFDSVVAEAALHRSTQQLQSVLSSKPQICTMRESTPVCRIPSPFKKGKGGSAYKWPSLSEAHAHATDGRNIDGAHDAMVDAEACLVVLRYLVKGGHVSLDGLLSPPPPTPNAKAQSFAPKLPSASMSVADVSLDDPLSGSAWRPSPPRKVAADAQDASFDKALSPTSTPKAGGRFYKQNTEKALSVSVTDARDVTLDKLSEWPPTPPRKFYCRPSSGRASALVAASTRDSSGTGRKKRRGPAAGELQIVSLGEKHLVARGNTFPYKEDLESLGGKWDWKAKEWVFPDPKSHYLVRDYVRGLKVMSRSL